MDRIDRVPRYSAAVSGQPPREAPPMAKRLTLSNSIFSVWAQRGTSSFNTPGIFGNIRKNTYSGRKNQRERGRETG